MKVKKRYLAAFAVTVAAAATAILPMANSDAAVACAPAWSSSQVYTANNQASQSGHNYTAKWWTQNESPATHSGQWDVWADNGTCGGGTTPTTPPPTGPTTPPPTTGLKMAAAPYIYPGWGNPPAPSTVMNATGIKAFTIAFVLANGCNPVWDSEGGLTGGVHASTINAIRAAGGDVVPSFGGYSGNKLGPACSTPELLAGAYQKVIDAFGLKAIDIDIENYDEFENYTVQDRILGALKIVKQRNPNLKTILTFGTTTSGPSATGIRLINQAKALGANVDIFAIMPFDFGGGSNMYQNTVNATEGLKNAVKSAFGYTDAQAYARLGISGMNGLSDQQELTTVATWTQIRDYAKSKGLARFTFWAVNRDRGCAGGGVVSNCSGIAQSDWAFTKISAGF
jgi:chitinase